MGHYVYKYVKNNDILYIGKNDTDLVSRINQHKKERKFLNINDADIFYVELSNKAETKAVEALLINYYKPPLNIRDKYDSCSLSFDLNTLNWNKYNENDFIKNDKNILEKPKREKNISKRKINNQQEMFKTDRVDVYLWGSHIGSIFQKDITSFPLFAYTKDFSKSRIQLSPITMPLSTDVYKFPRLEDVFYGLPGLLADSLPDKFGTKILNLYLRENNIQKQNLSIIHYLQLIGNNGMGGLEFRPSLSLQENNNKQNFSIDIDKAATIVNNINNHKLVTKEEIQYLMNIGIFAGGARAKALIAWNEKTGDIRSGQIDTNEGYSYWLLKFGTVTDNKDKDEEADNKEYQKIEYAYSLMTKDAGIDMSDCRLIKSAEGVHFATKRFDRNEKGKKIHMQSLGAIAHFDFNDPGAHSYEETAVVMKKMGLKQDSIEQLFKRMVFNEVAKNYDDHVKNISFLMDRQGKWRLAPAYDMTFSYNPTSVWTSKHQMTINGKMDNITLNDLITCGRNMNISNTRIQRILEHIISVVREWDKYASYVNLSQENTDYIKSHHKYSDYYTNYRPFLNELDKAKQDYPEACVELDYFTQKDSR